MIAARGGFVLGSAIKNCVRRQGQFDNPLNAPDLCTDAATSLTDQILDQSLKVYTEKIMQTSRTISSAYLIYTA